MEQLKNLLALYLKIDSDELTFLGSGCSAYAYLYNGRVYKLTCDEQDFMVAQRLKKIGKKLKHFVKVFDTVIIETSESVYWSKKHFLIVSELMTPFVDEDDSTNLACWIQIYQNIHARDYLRRKGSKNINELKFEDFFSIGYLFNNDILHQFFNEYVSALREVKSLGFKDWDNHGANVGLHNGRITILDFGCNSTKPKFNKRRVKKIDITYKLGRNTYSWID